MNASIVSFVDTVPWDRLEHAYGPASDIPALLKQAAATRRQKDLFHVTDELCSRVLHQGTIYNASPPVARAVIEMLRHAAPPQKAMFYGLLTGFADSARKAIEDGRAIPSCAGGDLADGAAIRRHILDARDSFMQDVADPDPEIRSQAAGLLVAFPEAGPDAARLERDRYFAESDSNVRRALLDGIIRVRAAIDDWSGFLAAALTSETDSPSRFLLRYAQLCETKSAADSATVDELISAFVQSNASQDYGPAGGRFFEAIHLLGPDRELAALLQAFEIAVSPELLRILAERLLRLVFEDRRTGWDQTSFSSLKEDGSEPAGPDIMGLLVRSVGMLILWKLFPSLLRRKLRKAAASGPRGMRKVDYWGLEGAAPPIPPRLNDAQRTILTAFAGKSAVWQFRTNLWQLFGLPDKADELRRFVASRS